MRFSSIERVSPDVLRVSSRKQVRLRVEGRGHGYLRVGRERRWIWGRFDETFVVRVPQAAGGVDVRLVGIGGLVHHRLPYGELIELAVPRLRPTLPSVQACALRLPRTRSLQTRRIRLPRVVRLERAPLQLMDPKGGASA